MKLKLRVSLVIPAYNEEHQLAECLDAIARQTVKPFQVIVVDNNSTDQTAAVARQYPFVTLLHERRQGNVYARDTGFNAARGEIIGRMDADTHLTPGWVEHLQKIFEDSSIDAVSGSVHYYDVAWSRLVDYVDFGLRGWMGRNMGNTFLWGANMAIRRSTWQEVSSAVCHEGRFHEDLDLAAHLALQRRHVVYDPALRAEVSGRRIDSAPANFLRYLVLNDRTYARHHIHERKYMYPAMALILVTYGPARMLFRGYDAQAKSFSWRQALTSPTVERVDPAVFKV